MARFNNSLKFILMNANIIFSVFGVFLMAVALYLFFGNFGQLDPGFFVGTALVILFAGSSILTASCIGCQGAANQNEKFGKFWTGRKIIGLYQVLLTGSLAIELVLLSVCLRSAGEYAQVYPILESGGTHEYVSLEKVAELKFNSIYFSSRTTCEVTVYNQFWNWVDNHCPYDMSKLQCQACEPNGVTLCSADEDACYATSDGGGAACPYTQCRAAILKYLSVRITPVSYAILAVCAFQFVVAVINLMIMCFTPRDDLEKILIKSGTLAAAKSSTE